MILLIINDFRTVGSAGLGLVLYAALVACALPHVTFLSNEIKNKIVESGNITNRV